MSARPDSASSFSRYSLLPSIGLRAQAVHNNASVSSQNTAPTSPPKQRPPSLYREPIQREATIYREQPIYREPASKPQQKSLSGSSLQGALAPQRSVQAERQDSSQQQHMTIAQDQKEVGKQDDQAEQAVGLTPIKIPTEDVISHDRTVHETNTLTNQMNSSHISSEVKLTNENENKDSDDESNEPFYPVLTRNIELTAEPPEGDTALLLAIKLPNGNRVQRRFLKTDTLSVVMHFAEFSSQLDFTGTEIVCDAPRQVFSDLSLTIADTGLQNRTIIHIQTPDAE